MLRGFMTGAPEPATSVTPGGTTAGTAALVTARVTVVSTGVGLTAAILPTGVPGMWFVVGIDSVTTARLFTQSSDVLYVGGVVYDNTTPYQIVANKAVMVACVSENAWFGVALG